MSMRKGIRFWPTKLFFIFFGIQADVNMDIQKSISTRE